MPLFAKHQHRDSHGEPAPVSKLRNLLEPNRLFNRRSIADFRESRSRSASPRSENTSTDEQVVQRVKIPINGGANAAPQVNGLDLNSLDLTLKPTPPTPEDARSITPPTSRQQQQAASSNSPPRPSQQQQQRQNMRRSLDHPVQPPPRPSMPSTDAAPTAVPNPGMGQTGGAAPATASSTSNWPSQTFDAARESSPSDRRRSTTDPLSMANGDAPPPPQSAFPAPAKGSAGSASHVTQTLQTEAQASSRPILNIDTGHDDYNGRASMDTAGFQTPMSGSPTSSGNPDVFTTPRRSMEPEATAGLHTTLSAIDDTSASAGLPPAPMGELRRPSLTNGERQRRISAMSSASISPVGSPRKMSAVLHSPPMPQPIANLPTLGGPSRTGPPTPSWGALALEGGPKSPQLQSPTVQNHASGSGFPFFASPTPAAPPNSKDLTDAEVRKATKSMPVMFRMPSHHAEDLVDGGEAEDDDDDDEVTDSEEGHATPTSQPTLARTQGGSRNNSLPVVEESSASVSAASTPGANADQWHLNQPRRQNGTHWVAFPASPVATPRADNYFNSQPLGAIADRPPDQTSDDTPSTLSTADSATGSSSHNSEEYDDTASAESVGESGASAATSAAIQTPPSPSVLRRPTLYSQTSQSMFNLQSPSMAAPPPLPSVDEGLPEWAKPPPTPAAKSPQLKRRLSAGDAAPPPPMYEPLLAFGAPGPACRPRDEEGREKLPGYWCGVHIEGTLSRKMEFIQPGVQAKDRGWKKFYFVLHGTALYVYKFDPSKVPLRQGEPYLTCSSSEAERYLHVHLAPEQRARTPVPPTPASSAPSSSASSVRRNTVGLEAAIGRTPIGQTIAHAVHARRSTVSSAHAPPAVRRLGSGSAAANPDGKNPDLFSPPSSTRPVRRPSATDVASSTASAPIASHLPFAHNGLLHVYSLTGAESGLAADYKKRLHCVRVRAEGQQFMLQTDTARQCVQWIEAFQAATNVAMDLDVRPMPIQHTLPRRRRRARRPAAAAGASAASGETVPSTDNANDASFADTPEGNIAAVEAAERAARERDEAERRRERMLEEDQANAGQPHGGLV